jgi:hypothetical protein
MSKNIVSVALKGIAVAMGVAVVVLNLLGNLDLKSAASMLGLGLAALAIAALQDRS